MMWVDFEVRGCREADRGGSVAEWKERVPGEARVQGILVKTSPAMLDFEAYPGGSVGVLGLHLSVWLVQLPVSHHRICH
jgi:hypothetical protein